MNTLMIRAHLYEIQQDLYCIQDNNKTAFSARQQAITSAVDLALHAVHQILSEVEKQQQEERHGHDTV